MVHVNRCRNSFLVLMVALFFSLRADGAEELSILVMGGDTIAGRRVESVDTPALSGLGHVLFHARSFTRDGFYTWKDVILESGTTIAGHTLTSVQEPSIDSTDTIVFKGYYFKNVQGQFIKTGGIFNSIGNVVLFEDGQLMGNTPIVLTSAPTMNSTGTLLFTGNFQIQAQVLKGIFSLNGPIAVQEEKFLGDKILDVGTASINNMEQFVFSGVYEGPNAQQIAAIFGEKGPIFEQGDVFDDKSLLGLIDPEINELGKVVYAASYFEGQDVSIGIFLDKEFIVGTGAIIDGKRLVGATQPTLDNTDKIAFLGIFEDNVVGIVTTLPLLEPDVPEEMTLRSFNPGVLFKLRPPQSGVLDISFETDDQNIPGALYFRWGRPASPGLHDAAAVEPGSSRQRLLVPSGRGEIAYVYAEGLFFNGKSVDAELTLRVDNMALLEMSPSSAAPSEEERVSAVILGAGFDAATRFALEGKAGILVPTVESTIISSERAEVVFDFSGAAAGRYNLQARSGRIGAELKGAFELLKRGIGPRIETRLTGVEYARHRRLIRLTLGYKNTGDAEATAPLYKIMAPNGVTLGLPREAAKWQRTLLVMGIPGQGLAGVLPPGGEGELSILVQPGITSCPGSGCAVFPSDACTECPVNVELVGFAPKNAIPVEWNRLKAPPGVDRGDWDRARIQLPKILGNTWSDVHRNLARLATRLARRGRQAASVRELFRFAMVQALELPSMAIAGRVIDVNTGAPLAKKRVMALEGFRVVSTATTDGRGAFALEWLEDEKEYTIAVDDMKIADISTGSSKITLEGADLLDLTIAVSFFRDILFPVCPNCVTEGLPEEPLLPPANTFEALGDLEFIVRSSWDPNEKDGPMGDGDDNLLPAGAEMEYRIYFENLSTTSLPAQIVEVVDALDNDLDWSTFRATEVRIGGDPLQIWPLGDSGYWPYSGMGSTSAPYTVNRILTIYQEVEVEGEFVMQELDVEFAVRLDPTSGQIVWSFQSLTSDPFAGFLLPNDDLLQGEAAVAFSVAAKPDLGDGTDLRNEADITFDTAASINTNTWINIIGSVQPEGLFIRGDANGDGVVNISDSSFLLNFLFLGGADLPCLDAGDANDDGEDNISDASFILNFLFLGGPGPTAPGHLRCGRDPSIDALVQCDDPLGVCE